MFTIDITNFHNLDMILNLALRQRSPQSHRSSTHYNRTVGNTGPFHQRTAQ